MVGTSLDLIGTVGSAATAINGADARDELRAGSPLADSTDAPPKTVLSSPTDRPPGVTAPLGDARSAFAATAESRTWKIATF